MKKSNLKKNCFLAVLLIIAVVFSACKKRENRVNKITRNGDLTLENLYEIITEYYSVDGNAAGILGKGYKYNIPFLLKETCQYEGERTREALEQTYRLGFHFKFDYGQYKQGEEGYPSFMAMALQPCDSNDEYNDYTKYPIHNKTIIYQMKGDKPDPLYSIYFDIADLKKAGYIAQDRDKQKDLCLFEKIKIGGMGYMYFYSSNKLIYTAEEINAIMGEYEALR